jgi:prepilin signal peptidase PulO-like enzyme (type II secretory pathway)
MQNYVFAIPLFILGWVSGALLDYLADILPIRRQSCEPFCLKCGKPMQWKNYFFWPRKCPHCNSRRPWRTWIVEVLTVVGVFWLWIAPPHKIGFVIGLALLLYFGLIVIIDIERHMILQWVCLAGVAFGVIVGTWLNGLEEAIIGGVIGFVTMLVLYYAGKVILKWIARRRTDANSQNKDALGLGDVILGGIIGLLLGYKVILTGLVVAVLIGSLYSLVYLLMLFITRRYKILTMIPYGPFLIASAIFILYIPNASTVLSAL